MTVTAIPGSTTTATAPQASATPKARSAINSDFDTFLKMLTTQLQNQDPLDPVDNSEYAVQLATFSGVEQQVKTNELLAGLGGQMGLSTMTDLARWVGKQARAEMPVWFEGKAVTFTATPDPRADAAELVVKDATGKVVARDSVPRDGSRFEWNGKTSAGTDLPTGKYSLSLESSAAGRVLATSPVESYGTVVEARNVGGKTVLVFTGGIEVQAERVTALRDG